MVVFLSEKKKKDCYRAYIETHILFLPIRLSHINFSSLLETTFIKAFSTSSEKLRNEVISR